MVQIVHHVLPVIIQINYQFVINVMMFVYLVKLMVHVLLVNKVGKIPHIVIVKLVIYLV